MILKPSIDSLLQHVNSKYSLVILASKRAHELEAGDYPALGHYDSVKPVGQALEEIDAGEVIPDPEPELKREKIRKRIEKIQLARAKEQAELQRKVESQEF